VRASADTVAFLRAQILVSLLVAVITAAVTGVVSADVGERFNTRVAVYAAVVAAALVALGAFVRNVVVAPWRLHEDQAGRLRAFERRPDVAQLVQLRERGIELRNEPLKRPLQDEEQLGAWRVRLQAWEDETAAELEKCASKIEASTFRVLDTYPPRVFHGVTNEQNAEMAVLTERLDRLTAIISVWRRSERPAAAGLRSVLPGAPPVW
jgi:Co/Zn/Cd efflux system component